MHPLAPAWAVGYPGQAGRGHGEGGVQYGGRGDEQGGGDYHVFVRFVYILVNATLLGIAHSGRAAKHMILNHPTFL